MFLHFLSRKLLFYFQAKVCNAMHAHFLQFVGLNFSYALKEIYVLVVSTICIL